MKFENDVDRGATAVLVAISLFVLMGFSAIAVDYGAGVTERRLDQNSADTAALSAGVELIVGGDQGNLLQAAVDSAKLFVNDNLDRDVSGEWAGCFDPGALESPSYDPLLNIPLLGIVGGSQCISFGSNDDGIAFAKIRVRIPDQTTPPIFSRVLGFTGLVTDAFAEVTLDGDGLSGAFPAGVLLGTGAGDTFCIKTGTNPNVQKNSCGTSTTGDFGNFNPYFYTEVSPGNPSTLCRQGNAVAPLSRAMADGIDHFLGTAGSSPGTRINGDDCPQFPGPAFPNRVDSGGGSSSSDITNGLVAGGVYDGAFTGRLTRMDWGSTYGTATVFGFVLDNRPLWKYIDTSVLAGTPTTGPNQACWSAENGPSFITDYATQDAAYLAAQADLLSCLGSPQVPDSLFLPALYLSPRLTVVPEFWQDMPLPSNSCCYDIKTFVPVFIDAIWTSNGPQWTCGGGMVNDPANGYCKSEPGRAGSISISAVGQRKIDSANAIVLSCDILPGVAPPEEKCKKVENSGGTVEVFLDLFLTR